MYKKIWYNLGVMFFVAAIMMAVGQINGLPWWSFVVPTYLAGMVIGILEWPVATMMAGFLSGFVVWVSGNLYFDSTQNGSILEKVAGIFSVSRIGLLLIAGAIGGTMAGLTLYSGKALVTRVRL